MKENLFVRSDIYNIRITTNCSKLKDYIEKYIDDFSRLTINTEIISDPKNYDMTFRYIDENNYKIKYDKKNNEMILFCPFDKIDKSTVIPMMFRIIVELLRQKNKEIKLHASAIEKNNKVAILLAPSEGGKTTTALSLCQNYDCIMRANDASVVKFINNSPIFLRGDKSFRFRLNSLEAYSKSFYDDTTKNHNKKDMPWYDRIKMNANDLNISVKDESTKVKYIFFVKLDPLMKGCNVKKYDLNEEERRDFWLKYKLQIFSNIGGSIKGNDLIPVCNDGTILPLIIPNFDNSTYIKRRINFINKLFDKCEVYQIRGELESITDFINNLL